jgi:hypothetical protein
MADEDSGGVADDRYPDDLRDIQSFVIQLRELLEAIVEDGRHVPPSHRDGVREAWAHAKSDSDKLVAALAPAGPSSDQRRMLEDHGLTGKPLGMKLKAGGLDTSSSDGV